MPQNANALKHGRWAVSGLLPKSHKHIAVTVGRFRSELEHAVVELRGEITLMDAAIIQTAVRYERHAQIAQRYLRVDHEQLDAKTRLEFSLAVAKASAERDRSLRALGLDQRDGGSMASIYDIPAVDTESQAASDVKEVSP